MFSQKATSCALKCISRRGFATIAQCSGAPSTFILHRTPWSPPIAKRAKGIYIEREDGVTMIDAVGGAAVTSIGHGHPTVLRAMKEQLDKICCTYNMQLSNEPAEALARHLVEGSNGAFELCGLVSGGSEAMEGSIKAAKQYFYEKGDHKRVNFIGRDLSFHGNTVSMLSLAVQPGRRAPYEGMLDKTHFHHVSPAYATRYSFRGETEVQYVERLRHELEQKFLELGPETIVAFAAETVTGTTTGVVPPPKGYFKAMKSVCDKYGALFILDEVMCGMGRMGSTHTWQTYGDSVAPDIQAVAKGLGGGYAPIGAVLLSSRVARGLRGDGTGFWKHGHTYQALPIACAAALAVQKVIASENLLVNCRTQGAYLGELLTERLRGPFALAAPVTFDVRGGGCFWGVEFDMDRQPNFGMRVQQRAFDRGMVIMGFPGERGGHVMLAPPYNVTRAEVEQIVNLLRDSVEDVVLFFLRMVTLYVFVP
ncbi:PLP-dependent transferase [Fistulina hepatica ATCC 64428]|uniref:PLP-dependent transferase n=1 Tax=Fistulina hepatica ATCC 64428 TaxID=1128425 RepID=A0A0D7AML4_9AGAR|nr:PLP-dependent transferase [Fistulina hepatica ATCC 64428]